MVLLVTSASGANGSGYGKLLAFGAEGEALGPFSDDVRIVDPRGLGSVGSLLFVNSGSDRILALDDNGRVVRETRVIPWLNLDLTIAPDGNVLVSSEHPFGAPDAVTTIREYDRSDGHLVRVLIPDRGGGFKKPRGLRFGPDGKLYCVAQDEVVALDFATGESL